MTKVYKARKGANFGDERAQVYGSHLEELAKKSGKPITPAEIVKDAKKKKSPTHDYFDWNDDVAGAKWRIQQARSLLGHIEIEVVELNNAPIHAFFNIVEERTPVDGVETKNDRGYVHIDSILSEEEYRTQIIHQALKELTNWRHKYELYNELNTIFKAIKIMEQKYADGGVPA